MDDQAALPTATLLFFSACPKPFIFNSCCTKPRHPMTQTLAVLCSPSATHPQLRRISTPPNFCTREREEYQVDYEIVTAQWALAPLRPFAPAAKPPRSLPSSSRAPPRQPCCQPDHHYFNQIHAYATLHGSRERIARHRRLWIRRPGGVVGFTSARDYISLILGRSCV